MNTVNDESMNSKKIRGFYQGYYFFIKRLFDVLGSILGLIITSPIILIFLILVFIETPGNPIYKQERLGKSRKKFYILKIRSMYKDAEKNGAQWASCNDTRITKIGAIIRKTRIDELPQLLNILKGDMSIVGPRPEREEFADEFVKLIPHFEKRLLVKPGLTGLAQINGGYDLTPEQKIAYDIEYINNQSLLLDFKIILSTFRVVLTGEGAR